MPRYALTLSYDGSRFFGWQKQAEGVVTVQAALEHALSQIAGEPVSVIAAGRTDTGVHASMMVAHFDTDAPIDPEQMAFRLNRILPQDIAVQRVQQVDERLHARFDAKRRTYHYFVYGHKDPYLRHYAARSRLRTDEPCSGNFD